MQFLSGQIGLDLGQRIGRLVLLCLAHLAPQLPGVHSDCGELALLFICSIKPWLSRSLLTLLGLFRLF